MTQDSQLELLLDQWEEAREKNQPLSPEKLCEKHPGLVEPLKKRIKAIEAFDKCVDRDDGSLPLQRALEDESARVKQGMPQVLAYDSSLVDLVMHERGGLGVVYRGLDEKLNRNVAIKFIQPRHARNQNLTQRFMQEAEITGRLDHPGVVPVYAIGHTEAGQPFYSMRFIRGESLDSQIKRFHKSKSDLKNEQQRLRMRQMLGSMVSVCRTIAYSHTRGIVHRDIKPQNIMLGKYGEALVVDWGLALPIGRDSRFRVSDETTLRPNSESDLRPDMGEGTPVYMSPEQASGQSTISPASDIYSLGVTLYKVVTGQLAFNGMNAVEVRSKIIAGDFVPPSQHDTTLSRPLESICLKAMSLDQTERYEKASDLADDLESWLADNPVAAHDYSSIEKAVGWSRRHQGLIGGLAAGVLMLSLGFLTASGIVMGVTRQKIEAQGDAIAALQVAQQNQLENLNMTCRVAAKSIRLTLEASVASIEDLASSDKLIELLSSESPAEGRAELETVLETARCLDEENVPAISWFVLDGKGQLLARSSETVSTIKLNQPMWTRLYYHGGETALSNDLPEAERPKPISKTVITPVFIGKGKGWRLCSISTPVRDKNQFVVGVIGMTIQVGRFDPATQLDAVMSSRIVSMVETRGRWAGSLIHHPDLPDPADHPISTAKTDVVAVDDNVLQQLRAISQDDPKPATLDPFADPLIGESAGAWIAVATPVRIKSRRFGWLNGGWYLIAQDHPYQVSGDTSTN